MNCDNCGRENCPATTCGIIYQGSERPHQVTAMLACSVAAHARTKAEAGAREAALVGAIEALRLRVIEWIDEAGGYLDGKCIECGDEKHSIRGENGHAEGCVTGDNDDVLRACDAALAIPSPAAVAMIAVVEAAKRYEAMRLKRTSAHGITPPMAMALSDMRSALAKLEQP